MTFTSASLKKLTLSISAFFCLVLANAQQFKAGAMDELLYGVAYYYEYMPTERLEEDIKLMKECGITVVRIAESTWAYQEPQDGVFNMDYHTRIMDAMHKNGIKVIIGTPTYAFPSWLAKKHPDILLTNKWGQRPYGARQIMDIANPDFLFHAERIIRKLMEATASHPAVIGFQVDNETKHYDTEGKYVQEKFVAHLKEKFGTPDKMNKPLDCIIGVTLYTVGKTCPLPWVPLTVACVTNLNYLDVKWLPIIWHGR